MVSSIVEGTNDVKAAALPEQPQEPTNARKKQPAKNEKEEYENQNAAFYRAVRAHVEDGAPEP